MRGERGYAKAKAILLGGFAAWAALCACLSLVGFAFFLIALFTLDEYRTAWSEWGYSVCLGAAVALSCRASFRFGWRVGRDWHCGGR
jgi:peptidoglycan/LPS O-acetylase OafA/YrhL